MVDFLLPRELAEGQFKGASAEAALFELRMRMLAVSIPKTCDCPIDTKLSDVRDAILLHYHSELTDTHNELLKKACTLRNKLLHCEFSSARKQLDQLDPKARGGGITKLDISGLDGSEMAANIGQAISGQNVGQTLVADTKTKTLKDIFAWLHECHDANEFEEARIIFCQAIAVLERLARVPC